MKLFNKFYLWFRGLFRKPKLIDNKVWQESLVKASSPYREQNKEFERKEELEIIPPSDTTITTTDIIIDYNTLFLDAKTKYEKLKEEEDQKILREKEKFLEFKNKYIKKLISKAVGYFINYPDQKEIEVRCKDLGFYDHLNGTHVEYLVEYINNLPEMGLTVSSKCKSYHDGYVIVIDREQLAKKLGK